MKNCTCSKNKCKDLESYSVLKDNGEELYNGMTSCLSEYFNLSSFTGTTYKVSDNKVLLSIPLKQFKKSEVKINIAKDFNSIEIIAKNKNNEYYQSYSANNVDIKNAKSSFKDGVLTITIPKLKEDKVEI